MPCRFEDFAGSRDAQAWLCALEALDKRLAVVTAVVHQAAASSSGG
jgi:hypothetical protein